MSFVRSKLLIALLATVVLSALTFFGATTGLRALRSTDPDPGEGPVSLPEMVYNAPETVPTSEGYGAPGAVSMVFPGTEVSTGLRGEQERPLIAIAGHGGAYRALSAPHRPAPREEVSVSPDGEAVAWAYPGGVVLYDPTSDEAREVEGFTDQVEVGPFSNDGSRLLVRDGDLRVVEVASGNVVASLDDVEAGSAAQAVWTSDGAAVTYIAEGALVRHDWRSGERARTPASIAPDATLAWSPGGRRLAALRETRGVKVVDVYDVGGRGSLSLARSVEADGYAIQQLLGFSGDNSVAVVALRLESGPLETIYSMSAVDDRQPLEMTQLPGPGENWTAAENVHVAADALVAGSVDYPEPRWPWSRLAVLVASTVFAVFGVGFWFTRPARRRRRRRRRRS